MKQFVARCAVVIAVGGAVALLTREDASANNADLTIKQIMQKINGKQGIFNQIKADSKQGKWDDLQAKAKELIPLAKDMEKLEPPKGDKDSWAKLTAAYTAAAEELEKAAAAKDNGAVAGAIKSLSSCGPCHTAHKGKK